MSDYIKREDAEKLLRYNFLGALTEEERVNELNKVPSADVIEVVRCKDCKHLYKDGECPLRTWWTHTKDDYCSYGK